MTDCGVYDELPFSLAAETEPKALKLNLQKPSVLNVELLPKEGFAFDLMKIYPNLS